MLRLPKHVGGFVRVLFLTQPAKMLRQAQHGGRFLNNQIRLHHGGPEAGHDQRRAALLLLGIAAALLFGAGGRGIFVALRVALRFQVKNFMVIENAGKAR